MATNLTCTEIGEKLGPFDVAMIPIWRGGSLSFINTIGLRVRRAHHTVLIDSSRARR